jgi:hypothetical protein
MNSSNKECRNTTLTDKYGNIIANNLEKEDNNLTDNEPNAYGKYPRRRRRYDCKGQQELQEWINRAIQDTLK